MKKTVSLLLVLGCISATISCKKETITAQNESGSLSATSVSDAVASTSKFGTLVNGGEGSDKIAVATKMGVGYMRNAIVLETYNGKAPMVDQFINAGFKVLLNINNSTGGTVKSYPTDMVKYKKNLENVLNSYHPEVVVIENEPINESYYTGPIENYITELRTAVDVCKARGIKVADGGLHIGMVSILVYQDYVSRGMQKEADAFAAKALTSAYLKAAQGKGSTTINTKLDKTKKQITAFKTMALDYVNFHWYQPASGGDPNKAIPGIIKEIADYLRRATGKEVLCNEFGQYNQSTSLIASMVNEFKLAGLSYGIVFSGDSGSGAQPLHKNTDLLPNGISYRDAVAQ